jgi:site-specific DNA-methyltransferase (adenine-specific)
VSPSDPPEVLLLQDDCRHALAETLPARSIDVVVTSPPYNLGLAYGRYDDRRPREEYRAFLTEVRDGLDRVLAPEGSIFLNLGNAPKDPFLPWDIARSFAERFQLQNVIHWVKSIAIDRVLAGRSAGLTQDLALGHYKPSRSGRFLHGAHEYIFHLTRTGAVPLDRLAIGVPYQDKSNVARWASGRSDRRCRGNTWFLPYGTIQRRATDRPHPAAFPPELPEWCYRLHGVPRIHRALDPFVGIGASAVAAVRVGVPFVGIDLDPGYLEVARSRVAEARGRRAGTPVPANPKRRPRRTAPGTA